MNSGRFSITLRPTDANNVVLLLDFNQILSPYEPLKADNIVEHTIALEDLHAKVGLFSLLEANSPNVTALSSQAEQDAAWAKVMKEGQKVYLEVYTANGNGPWKLEGEEVLQNRNSLEQPWALMGLLGTNSTALLGESLKLGVKIASKAQGTGGLKGTDYIHISGTWRKNTKIESKKKDDSIEALNDRIRILEGIVGEKLSQLPPNTLLGRAANIGAAQFIPNNFASIDALTNGLAGTVKTTGAQTINGEKTLTDALRLRAQFPGFWLNLNDTTSNGAYFVLGGDNLQVQRRLPDFGPFGAILAQLNLTTGVATFSNGLVANLPTSPPANAPAGTLYRSGGQVLIT